MKLILITCIASLISIFQVNSQEFITVGNAFGIPLIQGEACLEADTCFTLTEEIGNQAGAVWDLDTIDLTASFDATFCLYLGTNDANGADGFAFVMRAPGSAEIGGAGQGIGYGDFNGTPEDESIIPSVAIEFDTWDNGAQGNDIPDDHTSLFYNGNLAVPIVPTVPLLGLGVNAEDGEYHTTRIVWDALTFTLQMYFDDVLLLESQDNLIQNVFSGSPEVLWGFTSSTGGSFNLQQICFPSVSVDIENYMACAGETVTFSYFTEGITSYQWTDEDGEVIVDWNIDEGTELIDTLITTTETGTFFLDFEFNNNSISDSVVVTFIENPIPPFENEFLEICPETDYPIFLDALNPGSFYSWNTGGSLQQELLAEEGWYTVEIAEPILGCSAIDSIEISHYCEPLIIMPNVFSPNTDEFNRFFEPISFDYVGSFEFNLFNRWGTLLYSENRNIRWDGRSQVTANTVEDGVYFYTLTYEGLKGINTGEISGTVTVLAGGN